ncbi:MAG: ATP-binding protein [Anaerolineae bacterium]|jgi:lon-related putative ATP-dependent protease
MSEKPRELTAEELWSRCDAEIFDFETTDSLPGEIVIIGQERAVDAIDFGVGIASFGFNIYALGYTGTGRSTTLRTFLNRIAADQPVPDDWIYVYNFEDRNRPNAIAMPPGTAVEFRNDMEELVNDLQREIPRAFESEDYEKQKEAIVREMQEKRNEVFGELERLVNERGFTLMKTAMGLGIAPVIEGEVVTPEAYQKLDEETRKQIESHQQKLQGEMADTMRDIRDLEKAAKRRLDGFDREIADFAVSHLLEDLKKKYAEIDEVPEYLEAAHDDIVEHVDGFKRPDEEQEQGLAAAMRSGQTEALLNRYTVNVIVDNSQVDGAPVIFEANPTYGNLIGRIEHRAEFGALVTDFSMIKAGCLHRANGGYLIVEMNSLLTNPLAWDALKRSIKNSCIRTEGMGAQLQVVSTVTLEPEPIPLDVKVVLIGDPMTYYLLHGYDEDFRKLFKVKADFGARFDRSPETSKHYAQFIAARCREEELLPFQREAVARVVDYGSRLADHQKKLSTRFGQIADLVREASFWARRRGAEQTGAEDVQKAIEHSTYRANRAEQQIQEMIDEGSIRVDVEGEVIGQVNGLSVLALGDYAFGKPSRITVRTYTGRAGVVSLDREAKLSGSIYDKGLLTLTGYLGGKYALEAPLSLSASISFEQLYEEIEGDSASSTELYALLSSLSGLPIKQGLAITGSVDQQGNVQPIGGANEKIEGFFLTCKHRGLTGEQGVLLPEQNVVNLMLREEVRQAVADGKFHIYPVRTIDEGIEILTGTPAGELQDDGSYPEDSLHGLVLARLEEIAANLKEMGKSKNKEETTEFGTAPEGEAEAQESAVEAEEE